MDIFKGEVIPDSFINQDGDPFLFQLYRRWNCSRVFSSRLSNGIGGEGDARYIKHHVQDWMFKILDGAVSTAEDWLGEQGCKAQRCITLDVVVPCYRVDLSILKTILSLQCSSSCTVMFIIIVDNPSSPHVFELQAKYSHRADVRIRVNNTNLGASASRNRGMGESAADWVHFLDDDVVPEVNLLVEAERVIQTHPSAAGFVGNTTFPRANTIFTTAVHLAGVTYFWDIATKIDDDVPWGVTANLIARRNIDRAIHFDLRYPKTGGGEDIDFCRSKRASSLEHGGHPNVKARKRVGQAAQDSVAGKSGVDSRHVLGGQTSRLQRFHYWSFGDGALIKQFPELTYYDFAPNSAELICICFLLGSAGGLCLQPDWMQTALKSTTVIVLVNILHDCFRHLIQHPERNAGLNSSLTGLLWVFAIIEGSLIRMFSELGRLRGMIAREEYVLLGRRFDWFAGRVGRGPIREERLNNFQRDILIMIAEYNHYQFYTGRSDE
ncbi:unnamed protein product [Cyclocybe aegerita]|uniref:Glycosyltransferase 2-like domain-containing protein n=1 Tax=Cyclocybe aegerita TaxID=1973307 RepID=A0A8S0WZ24_CYCAE|nr:unnamed protein product [Cyclocybe aegerita]